MTDFWLCFVPLFVAVDAVGLLPVYLGLTEGFSASEHRRVLWQSMLTAMIVALAFLWVGRAAFRFLGITEPDFMIAGGILLFGFSMSVSKVVHLILAAIAVKMVRTGVEGVIERMAQGVPR